MRAGVRSGGCTGSTGWRAIICTRSKSWWWTRPRPRGAWWRRGGLVRWLGQRGYLHRWFSDLGRHHFLYASAGPSVGQWLTAHAAGGRLVAGEVSLKDSGARLGPLHAGEGESLLSAAADGLAPVIERLTDEHHRVASADAGETLQLKLVERGG